jgi:hypothetical protein
MSFFNWIHVNNRAPENGALFSAAYVIAACGQKGRTGYLASSKWTWE